MALLVVFLAVRLFWFVFDESGRTLDSELAQTSVQLLLWVLPSIAFAMLLDRTTIGEALKHLGLSRGFWTGCAFGVIATAPLGAMVLIGTLHWSDTASVAAGAAVGPLAESVLFAGFLFTRLFRRAGWHLVAALCVSAAAFGWAHSPSLAQSVHAVFTGDLAAISAGGLLFTWVFHRWNSLWPAIALHGAINFWWIVSGEGRMLAQFIGPSVTPLAAAHAASIVLAVGLTMYWTKAVRPTT